MSPRLARILVTLGGLGDKRPCPGTFASAAALALTAVLPHTWLLTAALVLAGAVIFGAACGAYLRSLPSGTLNKDPSEVVADEAVGIWITFLGVPFTPLTVPVGFVLFRFFDIAKPYPVSRMEKLPGVWGIFLDDAVAGLLANVLLQVLVRFVP